MKCYTHQLAFAAACAMAIFYSVGALLVVAFPQQTLQLWAPLCYLIDAELFAPYFGVQWLGYISGVLQCFVYTYAYAWILGSIYNRLVPNE